jgi:hypothetical protein
VSTDRCRVHFPACRHPAYVPGCAHVVGVVPSPRLCRQPFTRTNQHRVEALFFVAEPMHAHSRTGEVVRRRMSPTDAAGLFLAIFLFPVPLPSARRQFRVAAMAEPSAIGTHTNACNRGAEPRFTYLWPYSTFRRAVAANPNAPAHVCPSSHRTQGRTFRPLRP